MPNPKEGEMKHSPKIQSTYQRGGKAISTPRPVDRRREESMKLNRMICSLFLTVALLSVPGQMHAACPDQSYSECPGSNGSVP